LTIDAVVFDLWGTVVPLTSDVRTQGEEALASALGIKAGVLREPWRATYPERALGGDMTALLTHAARAAGARASAEQVAEALAARSRVYQETFVARAEAVTLLRHLRARRERTALVSNCGSDIPELYAHSELARFFDVAVFSAVERCAKPDPAIYQRACERLDVAPEACLYVGDGTDDELRGARDLGMRAILFIGDGEPPAWDGLHITSLLEIASLLDKPAPLATA